VDKHSSLLANGRLKIMAIGTGSTHSEEFMRRRHDIQHNDTQKNDNQHNNNTQYNGNQNEDTLQSNTQFDGIQHNDAQDILSHHFDSYRNDT
jgi:hypothetical protein